MTADECVHSADTTQLDFAVGKFVQTRRDSRHVAANCLHTTDETRLDIELHRRFVLGIRKFGDGSAGPIGV